MMTKKSTRPRQGTYQWLVLCIAIGSLVLINQATALSIINPPAAPPGGITAEPITVSATDQHKLGSLIIGPLGSACAGNYAACPQLCLNTNSVGTPFKCIKKWSEVGGILGASYVKLDSLSAIPTPITPTTPTGFPQQQGYVHLRGNNLSAYPVTSRFSVYTGANPSGTYTALSADGLTLDNNAGYFAGTLGIEPTVNNGLGRLCLNGTADVTDPATPGSDRANGYYCIKKWTDIVTSVTNNLTLQSLTIPPVNDAGNVGLSQSFNSAAFVIGDPVGLSLNYTCGDGMCSAGENSTFGSPKYCPIDCAAIKSLVGLARAQTGSDVTLTMTTGAAQEPSGSQVTVVVVRSEVASSTFRPMNGVTYAHGGITGFEVVGSIQCTAGGSGGCTLTDGASDLTVGKTYYYTAYQGNLYPRYQNVAPRTTSIKIAGEESNPPPPPDEPPPILH